MTELIGDIVIPSEIIVPSISGSLTAQPHISGALYISGAKLYFWMGSPKLITSA